jgi:hypothetical protein
MVIGPIVSKPAILPVLSIATEQSSSPLASVPVAMPTINKTIAPSKSDLLKQWLLSHWWLSGLSVAALLTLLAHRPMLSLIEKLRPAKPVNTVVEENIKGQWEEAVNKFFKEREHLYFSPFLPDEVAITQSGKAFLKEWLEKWFVNESIVTPLRAKQHLHKQFLRALNRNPDFQMYWDTDRKIPFPVQLDTAIDEHGRQILTAALLKDG